MKQIIALGGGGFSMEPDNPLLDQYVLAQTGKPHPKVCFLPTASGDSPDYIVRFYAAYSKLNCQPSHLSLFNPHTADLESFLLEQDCIYVGGGNTRSMMALWQGWDLPRILRCAWERGVVLAGISAGGNCWFEQCTSDSLPGRLIVVPCLGFLPGSFSPHYDGEPQRRPTFHRLLKSGEIKPGYAADNSAALHFMGESASPKAVCSVPAAKAYRLERQAGQVVETPLEMQYLG